MRVLIFRYHEMASLYLSDRLAVEVIISFLDTFTLSSTNKIGKRFI